MKLIICDIDGCLTKGKNHKLNLVDILKIRTFIENSDDVFTLCTGRSQPYVELFCQLLNISTPCICENGSYLYDPATDLVIPHANLDNEYFKVLNTIKEQVVPDILDNINYRYESGKDASLSINSSCSVEKIYFLLRDIISHYNLNITHSCSAVDITAKKIDKGEGLENLLHYVSFRPKKIIGIGDSMGDMPFLIKSDIISSPQNADKKIKSISHYVSEHSYSSAVLDILERL